MTIASEIQDLQTNLAAAKSAVTAKGGTTGNTGLAGLATEIAGIPSGGGGYSGTPYGKVSVYPWSLTWHEDTSWQPPENCTITILDSDLFNDFYTRSIALRPPETGLGWPPVEMIDGSTLAEPLTVTCEPSMYEPDCWDAIFPQADGNSQLRLMFKLDGTPYELEEQCGISITIDDATLQSAQFMLNCSFNIDTTGTPLDIGLGPNQYITGALSDYQVKILDRFFVPRQAIFALEIGNSVNSIPDSLIQNLENLVSVDISHATSLSSIGLNFLTNCRQLGSVNVGSIPATVAAESTSTFSQSGQSAPAYVNGVTLTGATASDWATRFPNRTTNPFRKLIVAS